MGTVSYISDTRPWRAALIAIFMSINSGRVCRGQNDDLATTLANPSVDALAVGTEVVFALGSAAPTTTPRTSETTIQPPIFIDRIDGDQVLISSRRKKRRQRVAKSQVVPFAHAIDLVTKEIAKTANAAAFARRAQLWVDHGDDDRALADLDQGIRLEPDQPWLYVRRSTIRLRKRLLEPALADCEKAIALAPNDVPAHLNRAKVWEANGDLGRAMADLDESARLDPTNSSAWSERSRLWMHHGQPEKALRDIDEAIRLVPDDAVFRALRAKCWAGKGDQDKAIAEYNEAIRLDPENAASFEGRAQAWQMKGMLDQAIADATDAIELEPRSVALYLFRGNAWYTKDEYDKAVDDDTTAIRLDPKNAHAYACRAQSWGKKHERVKQTADYTAAIDLEPDKSIYRLYRASTWSIQGQRARAMADYDEAVRIEPNNPEMYVYRGIERMKDPRERVVANFANAIADFDRATGLDPTYAKPYMQRGQIWKKKKEFDKLVREFNTLAERNPAHPLGHQALAWTLASCDLARIRDGGRAVNEATIACNLTQWKDENCLDTLAAAYAETGDFLAAVKWVDRAIEIMRKSKVHDQDVLFTSEARRALYLSRRACRE